MADSQTSTNTTSTTSTTASEVATEFNIAKAEITKSINMLISKHRRRQLGWQMTTELFQTLAQTPTKVFDTIAQEENLDDYRRYLELAAASLSVLSDKIKVAERKEVTRRLASIEKDKKTLEADKKKLEEELKAGRDELDDVKGQLAQEKAARLEQEAQKDKALEMAQGLTNERDVLTEHVNDLNDRLIQESKTLEALRLDKEVLQKDKEVLQKDNKAMKKDKAAFGKKAKGKLESCRADMKKMSNFLESCIAEIVERDDDGSDQTDEPNEAT